MIVPGPHRDVARLHVVAGAAHIGARAHPRSTFTRDWPPSVHRNGSTASASVGIGAPVCTRAACSGCRRLGVRAPASMEPITGRLT